MAELKATRELRYGGKNLMPGDPFTASDKDAKILKAIKKAEDAALPTNKTDLPEEAMAGASKDEPVAEIAARTYQTRHMEAAKPAAAPLKKKAPGRRTGAAKKSRS